jgi:hypothetical protein
MERQHREVIERIRSGHLDERLVTMGVLEPAEADPAGADPAEVDPAEVDPAEADPAEVDPAEVDPAEDDPEAPGPAEADPAEAGPAEAGPAEADPAVDPDPTPTDARPAVRPVSEPEPPASSRGPFEPTEAAELAAPVEAAAPAAVAAAGEELEAPVQEEERPDEERPSRVLDANVVPAQTLDQVILDYLNAEADEERLVLVMDTNGDLSPGREALLRFQARTSLADEPVAAADVRVRVITTSTEPLGLGRGETDAAGRLELRVRIPDLAGGAAALIVNARSRVGDAELKHLI